MTYPAETPYLVIYLLLMLLSVVFAWWPRFRRLAWPTLFGGMVAVVLAAARSTPDVAWLALSAFGFVLLFRGLFSSGLTRLMEHAARTAGVAQADGRASDEASEDDHRPQK